jgi:uncharacterized membrane protein YbhN (UPF0104 family)
MHGLIGQDGQTAVDLHRVGGHDLGRDAGAERLRDSGFPARRGAEDRDHEGAHVATILIPGAFYRWMQFAKRSHLDHDGRTLVAFFTGAVVLSTAALVGVGLTAGLANVWSRVVHVHLWWLCVAAAGEAIAYLGYIAAYREVARVEEGPEIARGDAAALVSAGFGPFVAQGGFAVDLHAFRNYGVSAREARVRVLGLGALEYAMLAPAACAASILLLVQGVHHPNAGITLPWAIAVPLGFVAALIAVGQRDHFNSRRGWRAAVGQALDSIHVLRCLFVRTHLGGPAGTAVYWFGDILCLWACLHAFEGHAPGIAQLVVGYATGYALTRRTLPFAGAGAVEALLPFALLWTGFPLAAAILGVFTYRIFNLLLPVVPAAVGLRRIRRAG